MTAKETIQQIQTLLGVTADGIFGTISRSHLNKLLYTDPDSEWPLPKPLPPQNIALNTSTGTAVRAPELALKIIKEFESCLQPSGESVEGQQLYSAYPDPGYGWELPTIGWGTVAYENGSKVQKGDEITQSRADELLQWEADAKAKGVKSLVTISLNENQFSALISFAYNVGLGALSGSTLLKLLNGGNYEAAAHQLTLWNKSNGQVLNGLTRRRQSERNMFLGITPWLVE